jgi:hypothetical protein
MDHWLYTQKWNPCTIWNTVFHILRSSHTILHSHQQCTRIMVSLHPCQHLSFSDLGLVCILFCVVAVLTCVREDCNLKESNQGRFGGKVAFETWWTGSRFWEKSLLGGGNGEPWGMFEEQQQTRVAAAAWVGGAVRETR